MDEGRQTQCCRIDPPDQVESDPDAYVCDTCVVAAALDGLDEDNRAAWALFQKVRARFVVQTGVAGIVIERLTSELSADDYEDVVTRLSIIYDIYYPPRKADGTPDA